MQTCIYAKVKFIYCNALYKIMKARKAYVVKGYLFTACAFRKINIILIRPSKPLQTTGLHRGNICCTTLTTSYIKWKSDNIVKPLYVNSVTVIYIIARLYRPEKMVYKHFSKHSICIALSYRTHFVTINSRESLR